MLALVTNNPRLVGEKSLEALGVSAHSRPSWASTIPFPASLRPSPSPLPPGRLGLEPRRCVSIGDRFDVDLAPAMELGMGAILVDGVEDVYRLPDLFAEFRSGNRLKASLLTRHRRACYYPAWSLAP
jgi:beta-phosphoglucomutase-like phosphatase (HAD superfamily)